MDVKNGNGKTIWVSVIAGLSAIGILGGLIFGAVAPIKEGQVFLREDVALNTQSINAVKNEMSTFRQELKDFKEAQKELNNKRTEQLNKIEATQLELIIKQNKNCSLLEMLQNK